MQMIELAGVIIALSMEVLVGVILTQLLKATSKKKIARPDSHEVVAIRNLYCLIGPMYSRVSAPAERPRDADEEIRSLRSRSQKDQVRSLNQEVLGYSARTRAGG